MLVLESSRPVTHRGLPLLSSKRLRCLLLAAIVLVASAAPAAAQEPDPEPAPTLPAPDPAPPTAPAPPKPAAAKPTPRPAAPAPAPVRTPAPAQSRYVPPAVLTPTPQAQSPSRPTRPKRVTRKQPAVSAPVEPLRRLPIRDASLPSGETALVLAAFGVEPAGSEDDGLGAIALAAAVWLGLAFALLVIAYVTPLLVSQPPFGPFLHERRSQFALVGANMVATAAVCYLVVSTA